MKTEDLETFDFLFPSDTFCNMNYSELQISSTVHGVSSNI